jgi:hypothetical protein
VSLETTARLEEGPGDSPVRAGGPESPARSRRAFSTHTGGGPSTVTLTYLLTIPANTYIGTYTSTWTFSIVSGP